MLLYLFMFGLIVFLTLGLYIPSLTSVTTEQISSNIHFLKRYSWFKKMLNNDDYNKLIVHDNDVRQLIGKLNNRKMKYSFYQKRYRKKLQNILHEKQTKAS